MTLVILSASLLTIYGPHKVLLVVVDELPSAKSPSSGGTPIDVVDLAGPNRVGVITSALNQHNELGDTAHQVGGRFDLLNQANVHPNLLSDLSLG